jgi:hypothetical protein
MDDSCFGYKQKNSLKKKSAQNKKSAQTLFTLTSIPTTNKSDQKLV